MKRTELVFILDMSGSMEGLTNDTIGGFNSILKEQAEARLDARMLAVVERFLDCVRTRE